MTAQFVIEDHALRHAGTIWQRSGQRLVVRRWR